MGGGWRGGGVEGGAAHGDLTLNEWVPLARRRRGGGGVVSQ